MIYLNGDQVNVTLFPDNTSQVWKLDDRHFNLERATIRWEYSYEGEFMQIAQLKNLLDQMSVDLVYLNLEYLPYGRQDKEIFNDSTFALHTFATQLNSLQFEEVLIMDPHSTVALDLINRSQAVYPHDPLLKAWEATESIVACYPDKGARLKYEKIYPYDFIYGEKRRDQATGNIIKYELVGKCEGQKVLIVDDICDGGRTFQLLAMDLFKAGAIEVNLFVTHGIFSKGFYPLKLAGIKRVFTRKGEAIRMSDGGIGFKKLRQKKGTMYSWMNDDWLYWFLDPELCRWCGDRVSEHSGRDMIGCLQATILTIEGYNLYPGRDKDYYNHSEDPAGCAHEHVCVDAGCKVCLPDDPNTWNHHAPKKKDPKCGYCGDHALYWNNTRCGPNGCYNSA